MVQLESKPVAHASVVSAAAIAASVLYRVIASYYAVATLRSNGTRTAIGVETSGITVAAWGYASTMPRTVAKLSNPVMSQDVHDGSPYFFRTKQKGLQQ